MSVSNTDYRSPATGGYACNGSTTEFAGTFRLLAEGDVDVILRDGDGAESTLTLTTDYTVTPTGGSYPADAFTVTTVATYDSTYEITLIRAMDLTQPTAYGNSGPYYPNNHETSYDRLLLQMQQLQEQIDRCVTYKASEDLTGATIVLDTDGTVILSYLQDGSVDTATIADNAVTYAKIQNVTATDKLLGRSTAGAGDVEEIACTSAGRALLDDASASAQRTTLGLGDSATKNVGTAAGTVMAGDDSRVTAGFTESDFLFVEDEKTAGTDGGAASAATWNVRDLNQVRVNNISGATLLSNQITLPAGTYFAQFSAPAQDPVSGTQNHKLRLRNTTDTSTEAIGTPVMISNGGTGVGSSLATGSGYFTLADTKVLELQHYTAAARATDGLGEAANGSEVEIYGSVKVWKVG